MDPITIAAIALGGALLLGGKKKSSSSSSRWAVKGEADRRRWLNEVRSMSYWYSSTYNSMPFLSDYLTAIGFIESRFNPAAVNPEIKSNPYNASRGLFGMRPETAFKNSNGLEFMRAHPNALLNPRWAFVTAVDHIWSACKSVDRENSGTPDWASIRRWWGYPDRVHDFNYSHEWSKSNTYKLEEGIIKCNNKYGTGIDPGFIWIDIQGYNNYPGMQVMVKSFGLEGKTS